MRYRRRSSATRSPSFREEKFADGIGAGLDAIESAIKGTYRAPAARAAPESRSLSYAQLLLLLVVLGGIGVAVIPSLFFDRGARRGGWTGRGTGWGGPFVGGGGFGGGSRSSGGGFSGGGGSFGGGGEAEAGEGRGVHIEMGDDPDRHGGV